MSFQRFADRAYRAVKGYKMAELSSDGWKALITFMSGVIVGMLGIVGLIIFIAGIVIGVVGLSTYLDEDLPPKP